MDGSGLMAVMRSGVDVHCWQVLSPFGLGVLDLAVGKYVYDKVAHSGELHVSTSSSTS
jgi:hypothetical protein